MDRGHHRQQRQSSLPSSLIPHLFSGPQQPRYSQTRTTLQSEDLLSTSYPHDRDPSSQSFAHHHRPFPPLDVSPPDARDRHSDRRPPDPPSTPLHRVLGPPSSQQYGSPIYSDPIFHSATHSPMSPSRPHSYSLPPLANAGNRQVFQQLDSWREGEAGPSSLLRPVSHDESSLLRHRRGSNHPLRVDPRSSRRGSPAFELAPSVQEQFRHRGESLSSSDHSRRGTFTLTLQRYLTHRRLGDYHLFQSLRSFERLPGPTHLIDRRSEDRSPSYEQSQERRQSYSYPAVGSLSLSAPSASFVRRSSSDAGSLHRSDAPSNDLGSNDGEGSQKGKRRRAESVETDDNAKKTRNPRKTAVACNFCRGR